jgi:hypothetical protein
VIVEQRVCFSEFRNEEWDGEYWEPGLSIREVGLIADKHRTKMNYRTIGAISLHALAPWWQRTRNPTEPMLLADIGVLADHHAAGDRAGRLHRCMRARRVGGASGCARERSQRRARSGVRGADVESAATASPTRRDRPLQF